MIFLLMIFSSIAMALAPSEPNCGRIVQALGRVQILNPNPTKLGIVEARIFENGMPPELGCKDSVITSQDSSAVIDIGSGKIILGPASKYAVEESSGKGKERKVIAMALLYGQMRASIVKRKAQLGDDTATNHFRVRTPTAVTGVRGTDFYISHKTETGQTLEATIDGAVEVSQSAN